MQAHHFAELAMEYRGMLTVSHAEGPIKGRWRAAWGVYRKRADGDCELVLSGSTEDTFTRMQDAHDAAARLSRIAIDKHLMP